MSLKSDMRAFHIEQAGGRRRLLAFRAKMLVKRVTRRPDDFRGPVNKEGRVAPGPHRYGKRVAVRGIDYADYTGHADGKRPTRNAVC